ncbi:hypothetical protein BDV96DRAFT_560385 [Lophiotrema nucula]|uniref:DUF6536 domain-containing protein n=1 Tax=Lophiotrema nucula TaxID=690887 RepID=A0A6A5YH33_9PLEO|nr:hypothetical protein BDV96DRAFT_560385 [Lophiotrema nucula]
MFGHDRLKLNAPSVAADEKREPLINDGSHQRTRFEGWRYAVLLCSLFTLLVLVVNIAVTIWAIATHGWGGSEGRQVLYEGSCEKASRLNTGLHFIINALSTVILSSSSYCMQCLSAPTRRETDLAHAKGRWVDVGILSVRNLKRIARRRSVLWCILGISTIPIHLFYNSTIFNSIAATSYMPITVTDDYLQSPINNAPSAHDTNVEVEADRLKTLFVQGQLERLENADCINAYVRPFQTRGSVLLVTKNATIDGVSTSSVVGMPGIRLPTSDSGWVCISTATTCDDSPWLQELKAQPSSWTVLPLRPIKYCLSEKLPEQCKVLSNAYLALTTIVINATAACIMLFMVLRVYEDPLMTIGDAISSYLEYPDQATEGMCLVSKDDMKEMGMLWQRMPKQYTLTRQRLFVAVSKTRWLLCILLYMIVIGITLLLLVSGLIKLTMTWGYDFSKIWRLGIGQISPITILSTKTPRRGVASLIANSLVANAGQTIVSPLYFIYNGLFTLMSLAIEWESFGLMRKGLRVSTKPRGQQRSSYFLQLPYRLSIPLIVLSGVLQWLVSQSLFLVSIEGWAYNNSTARWEAATSGDTSHSRLTCGYSPLAIILLVATGLLMLVILIWMSFLKFRTGMPVVSSCSAAIAAACHVGEGEDGNKTRISQVQWGVTTCSETKFGHCAFSQQQVSQMEEGELYM